MTDKPASNSYKQKPRRETTSVTHKDRLLIPAQYPEKNAHLPAKNTGREARFAGLRDGRGNNPDTRPGSPLSGAGRARHAGQAIRCTFRTNRKARGATIFRPGMEFADHTG
ncbi:hypothetical protein [Azospirillum sp.]|uniref:hypothetical protein n=1 Tax=Azospirillum sp. TaxID=34012 RepID=UPI002D30A604|nr:hypothetical protein [Azospirillum sp.]HYD70507.1 hypothetical protein [Azospirillum sp.]